MNHLYIKRNFTNALFPYAKKNIFLKEMDATHEIDQVIDIIKDGKWHTLKDVNNKSKLPKPRTIKILEFLANYNFIYIDKEHQKVKVTAPLVKFLKENSQTL